MHTIRATILQTPTPHELAVLPDHLVTVDAGGRIASVVPAAPGDAADESLAEADAGWIARFERVVQLANPAGIERVWVGGCQVA